MNNSDVYKVPGVKTIDDCIAEAFGISVEDLQVKTRKRAIVDERKFAMWWQKKSYPRKAYYDIGAMYANSDHATAWKAFKKDHDELMFGDSEYRTKAERALELIAKIKTVKHG